ncbi:MAG: tRNA lysidine(34) synthetase TilS [Pseudomonadota bacterium]
MVATRTPRSPDPLVRALADAWSALAPECAEAGGAASAGASAAGKLARPLVWAVACSGGRDSMALLHVAASLARERAEQGEAIELVALHVHHGLSAHADRWAEHVLQQCCDLARQGGRVRGVVQRVQVRAEAGDSVEAQARAARHEALQAMALASGAAVLWLAHHQRDQAETFMLQALRGGGVKGLAAMPAAQVRDGLCWARPWLGVAADEVAAHVARHALSHIEDDSNADVRWARNRLRHEVWPALVQAFPQAEGSLAMAAAHVADVLPVVQAWLDQALAHEGMHGPDWPLAGWAQRTANERRLLLAQWYRDTSGQALPASWVRRLAAEWPALAAQGRPWQEASLGLSLYRGRVQWAPAGARAFADDAIGDAPVAATATVTVVGPGVYPLPGWRAALQVRFAESGGVPAIGPVFWRVQPRTGGERWQAHGAGVPRALKKQFQTLGVPPWARQGPLVWQGDALLWVPGLGVDARSRAADGAPQWALSLVDPHTV